LDSSFVDIECPTKEDHLFLNLISDIDLVYNVKVVRNGSTCSISAVGLIVGLEYLTIEVTGEVALNHKKLQPGSHPFLFGGAVSFESCSDIRVQFGPYQFAFLRFFKGGIWLLNQNILVKNARVPLGLLGQTLRTFRPAGDCPEKPVPEKCQGCVRELQGARSYLLNDLLAVPAETLYWTGQFFQHESPSHYRFVLSSNAF
jgi:hypothetical protein